MNLIRSDFYGVVTSGSAPCSHLFVFRWMDLATSQSHISFGLLPALSK
ncbi:hypothetical protein AAAC51_43090 [Priestia megaterium]